MDELNNILFDACCHGKIEVIKFIVQNNQNLIIKKDNKSNTALHIACENGIMVEGIKCLYSAYPEALTTFNDEGASPFHSVCFHGKSVENLMFLLNELPNGLDIANEKGDLPIHWISEDTSEELINYILGKCPKSAEMKNNEDGLPIHIACNKGLSMSVIRLLHKAYPAGISQQDKAGILPIHDALEFIPNLQLIKFFYKVAPASFHKADNQGNLALHYAVCSSLEVVQFVTEANKLALQTSNKHGHLPIHRACHLSVDVNVIKFLHESYPKGIKAKTSKGTLPFHLAITSFPVLNYLYELFNHAVKTPDNKGRYPIHIACQKGAPINIISFLIKKCPYAAQEKDNSHMLPIHHALINNAPLPTIKYLIELFPSALFYTDANHRLPFHLAFLYTTNLEVIHFLRTNYSKEFEELMVHFPSQKVDNSMFLLPHKIPQRESDLQNEIDRMKQTINDLKQDLEDKKKKHNEVMPTTKKELVKNDGNSLYEDEDDINSFFEDDEDERLSTQHTRTRLITIEELPENSTEQSDSSSMYKATTTVTQEQKNTTKKNNYDNNNNKSNKKLSFEQSKRELQQQRNTSKTFVARKISAPQLERRDTEYTSSKEFRGDSFTSNGLSYDGNNNTKPRSSEQQGDHYQHTYKQNTSSNKTFKNIQSHNYYHPRYHFPDLAPSETDNKMPTESDITVPLEPDKKMPAETDCMEIDFNDDISCFFADTAGQIQPAATTKKELVKNDGNSLYEDEDDINLFFEDDEDKRLSTQHTRTRLITIEELPENSTEQSDSSSMYKATTTVTQEQKSTTKKNNYDNNNNKSNKKLSFEQSKRELQQQRNTFKTFVARKISAPQLERRDTEYTNSKEFRGDSFTSNGLSYDGNNNTKPRSSEQQGDHYQHTYKQNTSSNKTFKNIQSHNYYHPRYHFPDLAPSETDNKMPTESDITVPLEPDKKMPAETDCMEIDFNDDISCFFADTAGQIQPAATTAGITLRSNIIPRNLTTANNDNFATNSSLPQTTSSVSIDTAGQTQPPATAAGSNVSLSCKDIVTDIESAVEISQPDIKIGDKFLQTLNKEMSKMREVYRDEVGVTEVNIICVDHEEDIVTDIEYAVNTIQRKFQASQVHAPFISGNTIAQPSSPHTPITPAQVATATIITNSVVVPVSTTLSQKRKRKQRGPNKPKKSYTLYYTVMHYKMMTEHPELTFVELGKKMEQKFKSLPKDEQKHWEELAIEESKRPNKNLLSYIYFSISVYKFLKQNRPEVTYCALGKLIRIQFEKLTEDERILFNNLAAKDKKKYDDAMVEYEAKKKKEKEIAEADAVVVTEIVLCKGDESGDESPLQAVVEC